MDAVALPGSLVAAQPMSSHPSPAACRRRCAARLPATAVKPAGRGPPALHSAPARHVEVLEHPFERHTDFEAFLLAAFGVVLPVRSQPPAQGQVALAGLEGEAVVGLVDAKTFDMDRAQVVRGRRAPSSTTRWLPGCGSVSRCF